MDSDFAERIVAMLPRLRAFARALARDRDASDDLVQATCEKALRGAGGWIAGTRLDSWMFRIMQNQWIDQNRRKRPQTPIDGAGVPELAGEDGARTLEARLTLGSVSAAIDALPDEQRAVLLLVCAEEMSYREAAEVLGVPIGTVMSRLARARRTLVDLVGGEWRPEAGLGSERMSGEAPWTQR